MSFVSDLRCTRHPVTVCRFFVLYAVLGAAACSAPGGTRPNSTQHDAASPTTVQPDSLDRISTYIRCIFQDREGHLWFGTTTDGVVRYDGSSLDYFNAHNGFGSDWVNAIVEDASGHLWFATRDGVVRFDPPTALGSGSNPFTRYTTSDGLASDRVWCLLLDSQGSLWAGTYEGVSRFDGRRFSTLTLPAVDLSAHPYYEDPKKINAMVQDHNDLIWFATNGGGVYRYDGNGIAHLSEQQGLCSDFVQTMLVDREGLIWFGTRFGGLCTYSPSKFTSVDSTAEDQNVLYQQVDGTLWTVNMYVGLCRRDAGAKACFTEHDGAGIRVPMSVLEDGRGRVWIGTGAGLYHYDRGTFKHMTRTELMRTAV